MILQYQKSEKFEVKQSSIKNVSFGLFFNKMVKKNEILSGYGEEVFKMNITSTNNYLVMYEKTGYLIDAKILAINYNTTNTLCGHFLNRSTAGYKKNIKFSYIYKYKVFIIKVACKIDTKKE